MNKTEYFVFHREWYELKKELSAKAWVELEDYMLRLRFDGIDTDPKDIKNKIVRLQWITIRKKIYDSINNMNRQKKHRNQNTTDNNTSNETSKPIEPNNDFKVEEREPAVEYRSLPQTKTPQKEFISDEEKYGEDVIDLIVDNMEILSALKSVVEYRNGDTTKEFQAQRANDKIKEIIKLINPDEDFIERFEMYCTDFMRDYDITLKNEKE